MNILLTNDDGKDSPSLLELKRLFVDAGHKVFILAPIYNCSALSHSMTINMACKIQKIDNNFYAVQGKPCDCVITAIKSNLMPFSLPDIVISGINRGGNLGTDTVYSGTVAAARQACIYGLCAVALSIEGVFEKSTQQMRFDFLPLGEFALKNLETFVYLCKKRANTFLNINAPALKQGQHYKKAVFTTLSKRVYNDKTIFKTQKDSTTGDFIDTVRLVGENLETFGGKNADFFAVQKGFISITQLYSIPQTTIPRGKIDFIV